MMKSQNNCENPLDLHVEKTCKTQGKNIVYHLLTFSSLKLQPKSINWSRPTIGNNHSVGMVFHTGAANRHKVSDQTNRLPPRCLFKAFTRQSETRVDHPFGMTPYQWSRIIYPRQELVPKPKSRN